MPEDPMNPGHMAPVKTPLLDAFNSGEPPGGWKYDLDAGIKMPEPPEPVEVVAGPGISVKRVGNKFMITTVPGVLVQPAMPDVEQMISSAIASTTHQLQLADATAAGVAKVSVRWGEIAGFIADTGMDPSDDPLFTVTLTVTGVRIIYAEITGAYDSSTSIWTPSACAIGEGASLPADTSTKAYVKIGEAERESDGGGGYQVKAGTIAQSVSGNQGFVRNYYTSTDYLQHTWALTLA